VRQRAAYVALALLVVAFAWYVWPTQYRYYRLVSGGSEVPLRENRFTGTIEQIGSTDAPDKYSHWKWLK
jgi:hypothetical protein